MRILTGSVKSRPSVALLIEMSNGYSRGLLAGIMDYVRQHAPWSIYLPELGRGAMPPRWRGDGIIARIETKAIARTLIASRLPIVDVSAGRHLKRVPWVETDDEAIARLAIEHLLERGFRQLAFCGDLRYNWSRWRGQHFGKIAARAGVKFELYQSPGTKSWARERADLGTWVEKLPKPVGIMACYDVKAQQLLDVCREGDIAVPEEVAVIGVDNDQLLCNLASPPLSSVIPDSRRTGYHAAQLLDRMMSGKSVDPTGYLVPPIGVATRRSTEVLALADREVAAAVRFIREHACDGATIGDLLKAIPLSRRVLEARYRKATGRTPHQDLVRLRLERVKQLLLETSHPLDRIAALAGFEHPEYLSVVFKREVGITPGRFRRGSIGAKEQPDVSREMSASRRARITPVGGAA